ncbi:MAG TPA: hypothetical protein ENL05_00060, partial [Candidatus Moranbacteria bacterium]|nr:hypothetical protein [Candidatus Moranbacteria bacterium]
MENIAKLNTLSVKIEKSIIGQLLFDTKKIATITSIIKSDDFQNNDTRKAFNIAKECLADNQDMQTRIIDEGLRISSFIETEIKDITVLAKELKRISSAVELNLILLKWKGTVDNRNFDKALVKISREISAIGGSEKEKTGVKEIINEFEKEQELYAEKYKNGEKLLGISCGFAEIDNIIDGIRPGHFWIVGGYNNSGKTFFALNIVNNVLKQNKKVVIYSMEMSKQDIVGRLMGIIAGMNSRKILKGVLTDEELKKELQAKSKLYEANLNVYQKIDNYEEIIMSMNAENFKKPVDLFVIDYLQLLNDPISTEYQLMTNASKGLQAFGRKTGIPIIALSQVSNEVAKNPKQATGGYKGSGA